jgi:hypothetical protein
MSRVTDVVGRLIGTAGVGRRPAGLSGDSGPAPEAAGRQAFEARLLGLLGPGPRALFAALAFTLVFTGAAMQPALRADTVQDDFRQWGVWLIRLRDDELFRDDLIAAYYQAIAPPAYSAVYWTLNWLVDPLLAAKLLPPVLGLVASVFTYLLTRRLHPSRTGAFFATLLVSWYAWRHDDLASATPRAFALPLLAAVTWALAARRPVLGAGLVAIGTSLYPALGVLGLPLLGSGLIEFRASRPRLARNRAAWISVLAASLLVGAVLLASQLSAAPFGPVVSGAQARTMPEFGPTGRLPYFQPGLRLLESYESGFDLRARSPLFPRIPLLFEYLAFSLLLPISLLFRRRLPAVQRLRRQSVILPWLLLLSLGLFCLAHLLFFHLYHPSRYVKWSVPFVLAIAGGLALGILVEALAERVAPARRGLLAGGLALGFGLALAGVQVEPRAGFAGDSQPAITAYLQAQPKDSLVAGLLGTDSVPIRTGRRVLVAREHALPYHLGYYGTIQQRVNDLIAAYYAESPRQVVDFAARYGIDFFLVHRDAFRLESFVDPAPVAPWWSGRSKQNWEPFTSAIVARLAGSGRFALLEQVDRCAVVADGPLALLPTTCLQQVEPESSDATQTSRARR